MLPQPVPAHSLLIRPPAGHSGSTKFAVPELSSLPQLSLDSPPTKPLAQYPCFTPFALSSFCCLPSVLLFLPISYSIFKTQLNATSSVRPSLITPGRADLSPSVRASQLPTSPRPLLPWLVTVSQVFFQQPGVGGGDCLSHSVSVTLAYYSTSPYFCFLNYKMRP